MTANLFRQFPADLAGELVEILAQSARVRIERIVSHGQSSPPGFWYDQAQNEFVLLVAGRARLEFADDSLAVELAPGDWLDLKAHVRHRVAWTDPEQATVWLAVHYC